MIIRHIALPLGVILVGVTALAGSQVAVDVSLANSLLKADRKSNTYLRVALTGFELESPKSQRPPVNVAIVLDKSGSMGGLKMVHARQAAKEAIQHLGPRDIVSVVLYDSNVQVLVPATKVSDKAALYEQIDQIQANGSTALFAGVSKGAAEVRKFLDRDRVNRIILLSDGIANVGPSSPAALGELGSALKKDGIAVSTIGLGEGYNEDLMFRLADKSDGNHVFAQEPAQLAGIFNKEFGELLSVVAQEVSVEIVCRPGVRPVRVLGREAEISGAKTRVGLNQLYSLQQEYVLLEIEVPGGEAGQARDVADVFVRYANLLTKTEDKIRNSVAVRFSNSDDSIAEGMNKEVLASCALQIATDTNGRALAWRDEGKIKQAEELLLQNAGYLREQSAVLGAPELDRYGVQNSVDARNLDEDNWGRQRKVMREQQLLNLKSRYGVTSEQNAGK